MIIDFEKEFFTQDEVIHIKRQLSEKNYNIVSYVPVIIILKSNVLKLNNNKYVFPKEYKFYKILNVLKKIIEGNNKDDIFQMYIKKGNEKFYVDDLNSTLNDLYKYRNIQLNTIILYIERKTWTRLFKSFF